MKHIRLFLLYFHIRTSIFLDTLHHQTDPRKIWNFDVRRALKNVLHCLSALYLIRKAKISGEKIDILQRYPRVQQSWYLSIWKELPNLNFNASTNSGDLLWLKELSEANKILNIKFKDFKSHIFLEIINHKRISVRNYVIIKIILKRKVS